MMARRLFKTIVARLSESFHHDVYDSESRATFVKSVLKPLLVKCDSGKQSISPSGPIDVKNDMEVEVITGFRLPNGTLAQIQNQLRPFPKPS